MPHSSHTGRSTKRTKGLQLQLRTSGRAPVPISCEVKRELTEADLAMLGMEKGVKPPLLKKLKDSHHGLARVLASGSSPGEASLVTGFSLSRISILQNDPSFQELLTHYRSVSHEVFADLQQRMTSISLDALEELRERLIDTPEELESDFLLDLVKVTADRTGHGPSSKQTQVRVNVDLAERLEAARKRSGLVIEG